MPASCFCSVALHLLLFPVIFTDGDGLPFANDAPIVQTRYGAVRGMPVDEGVIFLGLPFGEPPVGQHRWKPPRPFNTPWAPVVRDGSVPGPACPQIGCRGKYHDPQQICPRDGKQSEDCLYLNIFAPHASNHSTEKLPVLFYIHGGTYVFGTGSCLVFDGRFLANKTNTIVVTTNYRLGTLGFLVAGQGKDAATGNYAILDQIEALKWVQANIGDFGGDKDRVTIFGQSAGADSVGIHMTCNRSAGLFNNAIMMSLGFSIPHKSKVEALLIGNYFADQLKCSHGDMKCLRSKGTDDVLSAQFKASRYIANPLKPLEMFMNWSPTMDGDILSAEILDNFSAGHFHRKPFIIGTVHEEGVLFTYEAFGKAMSEKDLALIDLGFMREKALAAYEEYNPPSNLTDYRPLLAVAVTELIFACPTRKAIRSAVKDGNTDVWLYVFDHVWSFKPEMEFNGHCIGHVCHGDDLAFVWQSGSLGNLSYTPDEKIMSDNIAFHYGNFAHTGDPNKPGPHVHQADLRKLGGLHWPKYNKDGNYTSLNITTPRSELEQDYRKEKCDFWDRMKKYTP